MPLDKKGGFHMNPQIGRMHDADQKPAFGHGDRKEKQRHDPGTQEDAPTHVEVHKKPDGGYMTKHHKGDGAEPEEKHHPTLHHALHAVAEHHGGTPEDVHNHGEPDGDEYGLGGEAEMSAGADEY